MLTVNQARVVQTLNSAIQQINYYPEDKYYKNQLRYSVDRDLSGDSVIHHLNNWGQGLIFLKLLKAQFTSVAIVFRL